MTQRSESEISAIRQHIDELRNASWLDRPRQWWPVCLFHCTDITNVVSILNDGELDSRSRITSAGQLPVDIASPQVIASTDPQRQDYVRLYFRPKTPTQFHNEGFRPIGRRAWGSHCPVPVYLLFDALAVLSRADSRFSDRNFSSSYAKVGGDVSFLQQIPFALVYHDTRLDRSEGYIVQHRNAEVVVPRRMGLGSLRYIVCRSNAEYQTLLHLLPPEILSRWVNRVVYRPKLQLFHRNWTFVDHADMNTEKITFRFNPDSLTPGPFHARVEIEETATTVKYSWHNNEYHCNRELMLPLSNLHDSSDYTARLFLDDYLAYADRYQDDDLPF